MVNIVNCVSNFSLQTNLNLHEVGFYLNINNYDPQRFNALIAYSYHQNTTAQLFKNGKVVLTGSRSKEEALACASKIVQDLRNIGYDAGLKNFKFSNIVGSIDFGVKIDLNRLAQDHAGKASYESELFPGLFYQIAPGQKATIFRKGKLFISGSKSIKALKLGFLTIKGILDDYFIQEFEPQENDILDIPDFF